MSSGHRFRLKCNPTQRGAVEKVSVDAEEGGPFKKSTDRGRGRVSVEEPLRRDWRDEETMRVTQGSKGSAG